MSRLEAFLANAKAGHIEFESTIETIDSLFRVTPCAFSIGKEPDMVKNTAGTNVGSLRIFAFAKMLGLDEQTTLHLFGRHYRDVLDNPHGDAHANIRHFMRYGWAGVNIAGEPLKALDPALIASVKHELANPLRPL